MKGKPGGKHTVRYNGNGEVNTRLTQETGDTRRQGRADDCVSVSEFVGCGASLCENERNLGFGELQGDLRCMVSLIMGQRRG